MEHLNFTTPRSHEKVTPSASVTTGSLHFHSHSYEMEHDSGNQIQMNPFFHTVYRERSAFDVVKRYRPEVEIRRPFRLRSIDGYETKSFLIPPKWDSFDINESNIFHGTDNVGNKNIDGSIRRSSKTIYLGDDIDFTADSEECEHLFLPELVDEKLECVGSISNRIKMRPSYDHSLAF